MSIIKDKAMQICVDMEQSKVPKHLALDPMIIIAVVGIIVDVVKAYIECRQNQKQAQTSMANPGLIERWRLRKSIRTHIDDGEVQDAMGIQLFNSSLNISKNITLEDVNQMFVEVQSNNLSISVPQVMELLAKKENK